MTDQETDFARYLQREWMWKQEPPLRTPSELATALGVPKQTAFNWLRMGHIPSISALIQIAKRTGLSFTKLMKAAGHELPPGYVDSDEFAEFLARHFEENHTANPEKSYSPQEIANRIRELEMRYQEDPAS
jgi:transcriptional regulator with XRE-family HTH domain